MPQELLGDQCGEWVRRRLLDGCRKVGKMDRNTRVGNSAMSDKLTLLGYVQGNPVVEATMLGTSMVTLGGLLPELAAVLPAVYYSIQILDSRLVKQLVAWLWSKEKQAGAWFWSKVKR